MDDMSSLQATVESIRAHKYPHIPAALVERILEIQFLSLDDGAAALRRIDEIIEVHLESERQA